MIGRRLLFVCSSGKSVTRLSRTLSGEALSSKNLRRVAAARCCSSSRDGAPVLHNNALSSRDFHHAHFNTNQHLRCLSTTPVLFQEIRSVKTPPFAESISEGDIRWQKKVGDSVKEDDVIAEIETDKTSIPVPSPVAGTIKELLFADGSKVTAGAEVCKIEVGAGGGGGGKDKKADKQQEPAKPKQEPKAAPAQQQQAQQPQMRQPRTADRQQDQQLQQSRGDGPRSESQGPIPDSPPEVKQPPRGPLSSVSPQKATPARAQSAPPKSGGSEENFAGSRSEHRVKMTRMRLRIAERLKGAQNTAAMLTTFNEIDMSNISELRQKYKDDFTKRHSIKLGFMSAFIRASSYALIEMPVVNAVIDDQTNEIVYRDYVDISVAVATAKGLVVPVLRNCEHMNFADIEQGLNALGEKAKSNQLAIEDMDGGTFTISNGGVFGSLMGTPIINPPQSAILGMHGIFDRPVAIHGEVKIRPMMYVALTYDHRLVDGREAVTFLRKIKAAVEDPRIILLGL